MPKVHEYILLRERKLFRAYLSGTPIEKLAADKQLTVPEIRLIFQRHLQRLVRAERKWEAAEAKCRKFAIENCQLLLRYAMADKRNFSHIGMPMKYRKWFERAGVTTIGRLRSVCYTDLVKINSFPKKAIVWAILTLDEKGLSHNLKVRVNRGR